MISTATKLFNEGKEEGIEKGREEGIEKGREEGIEKGREEGIEKGREEGIEKGRREVALRMLQQDMELPLVTKLTGLSIQQLHELKK